MRSPLLLAVLGGLFGCRQAPDDTLLRTLPPDRTGVAFANTLTTDDTLNALRYDYLYNGGGVAVGDLNGDGHLDLFFTGNQVSSRLYLGGGNLRFRDVTEAAGVRTDRWCTGVALVDLDQDGRQDLYVSVAGPDPARRRNLLFVNQGNEADGTPRFREEAAAWGLDDDGYSTQATCFDYDRDGDLDLYLLTNALESYDRNTVLPKRADGSAPSTDRLYRNEGVGPNGHPHFVDASAAVGIRTEGFGLGVVASDLNQDGWTDVYAANDFITNDLLWLNRGAPNGPHEGFEDVADRAVRHQTHNGMGTDVADCNNDGRPDVVVVDMLPASNRRQKTMLPSANVDKFNRILKAGYTAQYMRNTVQVQRGVLPDGTPLFSEVGQMAGVYATDWSWAPLWSDLDNDGRRDLFITNGYRKDVTDLDFIAYGREAGPFGTE
ncbi:MAG: VCBS repeat-containing protein, partial [Catalinimonas sp.]